MEHCTISSPIGPLTLAASARGLRAVLWPGETLGSTSRPAGLGTAAEADDPERARAHLQQAVVELDEYFAGDRRSFDVALAPSGTAFQVSAWNVLRTIPYGSTITYGEQAARLGDPRKARAVGAANGRNPLSIVVPCHRVVGSTGALTGFAGGVDVKSWLLRHEAGERLAS